MSKSLFVALTVLSFAVTGQVSAAREQIDIVGSSTVYPFSTVVAERFGKTTGYKTPKIESTGTGGGMKLFCKGIGVEHPDISNASRRIKSSEYADCQKNGVKEIVEVLIGYDGIVIANSKNAKAVELTLKDIFLALAKQVPNPDGSETVVDNPYKTWNQLNPALPKVKIEVLGPPPTSGTRDAFDELAVEGGCKTFDWLKAMEKTNSSEYKRICHTLREDNTYIEAGENDNLIVQKLVANPNAFGVFGFSFLDQNRDKVQGSLINGSAPTFENISSGEYVVSRPLYFYVKKAHINSVPGIKEFLDEFTSAKAMGEEGYLVDRGLIPLSAEEYKVTRENAQQLKSLKM
ncbi:MAG: PstS family phosphate ABC transporter substrate-binding protein [Gammaproteobacteria bacterium]|nr:PstS family phosphate ABC transporter substrate-binding protein [Gammaproteobacteria bacterium]